MEWIQKSRGNTKIHFDSDVVVTKTIGKNSPKIVFRFRKNSFYKIVHNEMFILVAKEGSRYYFKESSSRVGWKLSNYTEDSKFFKIDENLLAFSDCNLGEYNLEFDSSNMLCYIDTNRRLNKEIDWIRR